MAEAMSENTLASIKCHIENERKAQMTDQRHHSDLVELLAEVRRLKQHEIVTREIHTAMGRYCGKVVEAKVADACVKAWTLVERETQDAKEKESNQDRK